MSVADCVRGPSETRSCAESLASQKNVPIPDELTVHERDCETGLWDIMQISVLRKFRGTYATAWLQHALYKASCYVEGATRWIANMTRREYTHTQSSRHPGARCAWAPGHRQLGDGGDGPHLCLSDRRCPRVPMKR